MSYGKYHMEGIKSGYRQWKEVLPYLLPGFILLVIFSIYPIYRNFIMSLNDYNVILLQSDKFVGFSHYRKMLTDPKFHLSLVNTFLYMIATVPIEILLGLLVASLVNSDIRGVSFFRTLLYIPVITSWVVVSLIFRYLFESGEGGMVNYLLIHVRILKEPVSWLNSRWTANIVIWCLDIWKAVGWVMVIYLAALQNIDKSLYEASMIDGASWFQRLVNITVPFLRPVTMFIMINRIIGAFNAFVSIFMITDGGPLGRTEVLLSYTYKKAFSHFEFSYSSSLSLCIGLLILMITSVQTKITKKRLGE